jgi:3-phenylpropionate/trans-cinnamate dioxygenase ferredoxin subunit
MSDWVDVIAAERLAPEDRIKLDLDDVEVVVCKAGEEIYAFEDLCSHDAYPLGDGPIEEGRITCPLHGASFCLKSGEALTPPAYSPITVFPVRVENGMVQVRDDRWD